MAPVGEFLHQRFDRRIAREDLARHDRVLDRLRGALREVRCRRVHGIADQQHATLVPGPRHEADLERTVDHERGIRDLVAQPGHFALARGEPLPEDVRELARRVLRIAGFALHEQH